MDKMRRHCSSFCEIHLHCLSSPFPVGFGFVFVFVFVFHPSVSSSTVPFLFGHPCSTGKTDSGCVVLLFLNSSRITCGRWNSMSIMLTLQHCRCDVAGDGRWGLFPRHRCGSTQCREQCGLAKQCRECGCPRGSGWPSTKPQPPTVVWR